MKIPLVKTDQNSIDGLLTEQKFQPNSQTEKKSCEKNRFRMQHKNQSVLPKPNVEKHI
jgi:hypothetical protein